MYTALTSDQIATVRWEARQAYGRFSYGVGDNLALVEIATTAINSEQSITFAGLHIEAEETGYISCGMVADALNEIVRLDNENQMRADLDAAFARREFGLIGGK
jgi:hypothetical protein